jgi:hypothetical protein
MRKHGLTVWTCYNSATLSRPDPATCSTPLSFTTTQIAVSGSEMPYIGSEKELDHQHSGTAVFYQLEDIREYRPDQ